MTILRLSFLALILTLAPGCGDDGESGNTQPQLEQKEETAERQPQKNAEEPVSESPPKETSTLGNPPAMDVLVDPQDEGFPPIEPLPGGFKLGKMTALVSYSPDGKTIYEHEWGTEFIRHWNTTLTESSEALLPMKGEDTTPVYFSPSGKLTVLVIQGVEDFYVFDVVDHLKVRKLHGQGMTYATYHDTGISVDNSLLAGIDGGQNASTVKIWKLPSGEELQSVELEGGLWDPPLFANNDRLILPKINSIIIWSITERKELYRIDTEKPMVTTTVSNDGAHLAASFRDGDVLVWKINEKPEIVCELKGGHSGSPLKVGHSGPPAAITFSPDGTLIASGTHYNGTIQNPREGIRFEGEGDTVSTEEVYGEMLIWNLKGEIIARDKKPAVSIDFSPDGKTVVVGSILRLIEVPVTE